MLIQNVLQPYLAETNTFSMYIPNCHRAPHPCSRMVTESWVFEPRLLVQGPRKDERKERKPMHSFLLWKQECACEKKVEEIFEGVPF